MHSLLDRFDRPWCLWFALIAVLMWWISRRSLAGLGPIRSRLSIGIRSLVVIVIVLAMAGMHRVLTNNDLTVTFLLDISRSIPDDLRRKAESFIQSVCDTLESTDKVAVLTFDGATNIEQLPSPPGPDGGIHVPPPYDEGSRPDLTGLAQAMRMAAACAPDTTANRLVIASDFNQNVGDAAAEAKTAKANGMTVDALPLRPPRGDDIIFEGIRVSGYAHLDEQVTLRLIMSSNRAASGKIYVYQKVGQEEKLIDLDPNQEGGGQRVQLAPGRNSYLVKLPIRTARSHQWRAEFVPDDSSADAITQNNVARAFTNVEGPPTVLFIGQIRDFAGDSLLMEALRRENIRVDQADAESVDLGLESLQDYSAVVLANVPADLFSVADQQALTNFVSDLGGGLIMIGGDESFGAGGWQGSVVEEIMPVRFDVDAVRQIPRGALGIVMHSCEMPQGNKWAVETAAAALNTVSRLDYFGVVSAAGIGGHHWEVPMQTAANKAAIKQKIRRMMNADMFDFETPMRMAYNALMQCKDAAQRHMIIISDGDPQKPTPGLINLMVGNKVTCSTVLVFPHGGQEIRTMKDIANKTGGRYWLLKKPGDEKLLPKIFVKEARIVRRPLIRDEIFKPKVRQSLSDIMEGIGTDLPELKGYVVTTPRKQADVEIPLVTEKGDPLLAHWQCGVGRTVAFTSGRWKHWGADWTSWPSYSKIWAQTVRWCMRQGSAADYDHTITREGDMAHLTLDSISENEDFENYRRFECVVVHDGESSRIQLPQTGPGRYEAFFPVKTQGTYLVSIRAPGTPTRKPAMIRTGVTVPYSPEFKDTGANDALFTNIADQTGGTIHSVDDPDAERVFARLAPTVSRKPIWNNLLQLAIFLFLLDVAVRRIAIDPLKILAVARAHIASLAGRFGSGKQAEATLSDLKGVRQRVRTERTGEGDTTAIAASRSTTSLESGPAPMSGAKFDAAPSGKPSGDLTQLMGGAEGGKPEAPKPKASDKPGETQPAESMTARLLKARKKAKDKQQDDKQ